MEALRKHEELCRAMADPAFYPHPVFSLQRIDTHISTVFLTGEWVYKLKKPVDFGFLNFTDLGSRLRFCEREVSLNQRLSHGVYVGVLRIVMDRAGRFSLDGEGGTVDYAVKMRQLSEEASLQTLLSKPINYLKADMERLGHHLAHFYSHSERSGEIDGFGRPEVVEFNMEENFQQVEPFVDELLYREQWDFLREVSRAFFHNRRALFEKRIHAGRICDGHGDLRSGHIYIEDGIQIIDCIEFNDRFRYGDVIADLAFLHMDMERLGHPSLSRDMLAAYVERAEDPELYTLLDFYAAYRAIVKLKVACLRSTEVESAEGREDLKQEARSYLKIAYGYALRFSRPTMWVFCGIPASGKSSLAVRLSEALSLPLFQSDKIRKEGAVHPVLSGNVVHYEEGMYRTELRNRVYAHMLALAQDELRRGNSVVLDASFSRSKWREEAGRLAADLDTNIVFIECTAGEENIRQRLKSREEASGLSDARLEHLPAMMANYEPLSEVRPETHLRIDSDREISDVFMRLLSEGYGLRCAQVDEVVERLTGE